MYTRLTLLILFLFQGIAFAQNLDFRFKHLTTKEGLSQRSVTCLLQDSKGYMWFGTENGLNKFDGHKFSIYKHDGINPKTISGNRISDITEDQDGNVWVTTLDGGLNKYERNSDSFIHYKHDPNNPESISNEGTLSVFGDKKGNLWIATYWGLNKLDQKSNTFIRFFHEPSDAKSLIDNSITTVMEDSKGNIWVGTMHGGLDLLDQEKNTFTHFQHNPSNPGSLSNNYIKKIFEDSRGNIWVATDAGLNLLNPDLKSFTRFTDQAEGKIHLTDNRISALAEDSDGRLWIGTSTGGINILDIKRNHIYHNQLYENDVHSINSASILSLFKDKNNNMWIGTTTGGVNWVDWHEKKFKHFKRNPLDARTLGNDYVSGFAEAKSGEIWVSTGVGLDIFTPRNKSFYHFSDDIKNSTTTTGSYLSGPAMFVDKDNFLWVGTWGKGVTRIAPDRRTINRFLHEPERPGSLPSDYIKAITQDNKGTIWIGTSGKGLCRFNKSDNSFTSFQTIETDSSTISSDYISCLLFDKQGNFWIGTEGEGINLFDQESKTFKRYIHKKGNSESISSGLVYSMLEDSKGNIWIGTNTGLNKFDQENDRFFRYDEKSGLPGNSIMAIQEDGHGNLWMSTNNGISRFNPEDGSFRNFTPEDGLQGLEFHNTSLKSKSGEIYFSSANGFNSFHPDSIVDNRIIPPVYLTNFQIFNKDVIAGKEGSPLKAVVNETREITLSYLESVFSFEFAALNYSSPEKNQYAFIMDGFEEDWNYVGAQRKATYTNLNPGKYTFKVKAANNDGVWNEEGTALSIIITPPYWQTWWFRVLVAMGLIGGALTFYKVRMNAVKAQKLELERQVQEKTADIQKANNDLVERQEEILQQQEELQTQAEILQQANDNLKESQEEIAAQRDHLKIANEQVMSSIQYARTIQKAILPSDQKIAQAFAEYFILYRPKDVVSGDFYWFAHLPKEESGLPSDLNFMAVVDCTGHGVPGAFMSIIGSTLLNEIVKQKQITDPAQILEHLHLGVKQAVEKSEGVNTAGMDVCLCRLEKAGNGQDAKIFFSGAKRNLLFVKPGTTEVEKLLADRRSIGSESSIPFTTQELTLSSGSMLYLTSDGYADQNNPAREKLGSRKLNELFSTASSHPAARQKQLLETALDEHQQEAEQRDDITLLGIRL